MAKYRYVGNAAAEVAVGDKRVPVGMGDFVEFGDKDEEANQHLIDEGSLMLIEEAKKGGDK